jgi:hypothetical protein
MAWNTIACTNVVRCAFHVSKYDDTTSHWLSVEDIDVGLLRT